MARYTLVKVSGTPVILRSAVTICAAAASQTVHGLTAGVLAPGNSTSQRGDERTVTAEPAGTSIPTHQKMAADIWSVADLLRGDYMRHEYGAVILPFTVLRRLDAVLAPTRDAVRAKDAKLTMQNKQRLLELAAKLPFYFDHTPGVVKKIDVDSAQLAGALEDSTSKSIISTLQLYPYLLDKIAGAGLGGRRYAVIIDEAHSSQGGDAAARLKQALAPTPCPPCRTRTRRST